VDVHGVIGGTVFRDVSKEGRANRRGNTEAVSGNPPRDNIAVARHARLTGDAGSTAMADTIMTVCGVVTCTDLFAFAIIIAMNRHLRDADNFLPTRNVSWRSRSRLR
jgi:hypothetical protein